MAKRDVGAAKAAGKDASGNAVDLADFGEGLYRDGEMENILEVYRDSLDGLEEGQIVKGRILKITDKQVIVDVRFKSEGVIPIEEFKHVSEYKPGDEVEVYLENVEDSEGHVILSKSRADFLRVWDKIYTAYENQTPVEGTVRRRIKGGVVADLFGIDAFLPGSQIDLRQVPDMDALIGQTFSFRVIKVNKARRNIVVSRRVILEEERAKMREKILGELEKGQTREGTVKNITDFGAFIDLGGVDGLLHITDMSWGRVNHPSEVVRLGDKLKVKVLDFNENKERISLGLKQLTEHPWKDVDKKYPEGTTVRGKIVSITDYGAFMELERGIEGLIHISEMSWTQHVKHPSKIVGVGDIVEAMVLKVNKEAHKISLGLKQLEPDPWENVESEFPVGTTVKGKVRNIAVFGAFVELKEGVDGLLHVSDMSWTRKINHPGELLRKGDTIEVSVLNVDREKRRISVGLKQLTQDPWGTLATQYPVGAEQECTVARILDRGMVVALTPDVEGFIPLNQLGTKVNHPSRIYDPGDKVSAKVIEFDLEGRRIVLSIQDFFADKGDDAWKEYCAKHPVKPEEVANEPKPEAAAPAEREQAVKKPEAEAKVEEAAPDGAGGAAPEGEKA